MTLDIISELTKNDIPIYVQTPFVKDCNDKGSELTELYNKLRAVGAKIHYIFMPTSPIKGNSRYWAPLSAGLEVAEYLRAHLSDRAVPHICTATSIGKIDWNSSGWAVEIDGNDPDYLWIRTPYSLEYYESFAPILDFGGNVRENEEGTLDAKFMADIGDETLLTGPRELKLSNQTYVQKKENN